MVVILACFGDGLDEVLDRLLISGSDADELSECTDKAGRFCSGDT